MVQIKVNASATLGGKRAEPLWKGPSIDGLTQSLIQRYLCCPERFRIKVIEGWEARDSFRHQLEYGNIWHLCEEALASEVSHFGEHIGTTLMEDNLRNYTNSLMARYPFQRSEIAKWENVCKTQFPLYVEYWKKHLDVTKRIPVLQENEFKIPFKLPSGRVVFLRGKFDAVDEINGAYWIQENKAKGEVDEEALKKQLHYDLQTMVYVIALDEAAKQRHLIIGKKEVLKQLPVKGVRYNVIRRPLSGGKGSIKQSDGTKGSKCPKCKGIEPMNQPPPGFKKIAGIQTGIACPKCGGAGRIGAKSAETDEQFYGRLAQYIKDEPKEYFFRWNVEISQKDVETFKQQTLIPVLENLYDDYEWWVWCQATRVSLWDSLVRKEIHTEHCHRHYRLPYGVYNPIMEGRETELDEYLKNGNTAGLQQCKNLFPELKG